MHQSRTAIVLGLMMSAVISASPAFASGESNSSIAKSHAKKAQFLIQVQQRLARHQQMNLEQIKYELLSAVEQNRQLLQSHGKLSPEAVAKFSQTELKIKAYSTKEEVIQSEINSQKELVSAANYMFGFLSDFSNTLDPTDPFDNLVFFLFWPIPMALDLACFPFELFISIATLDDCPCY